MRTVSGVSLLILKTCPDSDNVTKTFFHLPYEVEIKGEREKKS
jgi:hypothetical protein